MKKVNVGETKGLKRKLDPLGRVVLPKEFRDEVGIKEGSPIEMFLVQDGIFLKTKKEKTLKYLDENDEWFTTCEWCGGRLYENFICSKCGLETETK